ncbi:MAG: TrkH family potassium uptake protein [Spirochaetaceae bacterium]|jgi:trk system potassium uptake protein TrkH|nr:TrkH family potassium uptake protein [Spirochaetaceae bacterium]
MIRVLHLRPVIFVLGIAALAMIFPLIYALALDDRIVARAFYLPLGAVLLVVLPAAFVTRKRPVRFSYNDGFLLVFLAWVFCCLLGAFPYYLSGRGISFCDAVFESSCGFATTGATAIGNIEALPRPLLLWRSLTHWFGGMGIVLLTVALLPLFGVGAFQLVKAEVPGPDKERVTPKITHTAKILWFFYLGLTAALFLFYRIGGMDWFDALCHALPMIATGGISTKNAGLSFYNSAFIDGVSAAFMLLSGLNFNLYYRLSRLKFREVCANSEGRAYFSIFIIAAVLITVALVPHYGSVGRALRYGSFQAASVLSTSGSVIADYEAWPVLAQAVLFALMFVGGCSGSTAGGIKVIRHVVLWKQVGNEFMRIAYPQGIFSVRLNRKVGRKDVVYGVAGFVCIYAFTVFITALVSAALGVDVFSSFCTALAVTGNIGIGFGASGPASNYGAFPAALKYFYSFIMLAGRLELWTVLILFVPEFWRK